MRAIKLFIFAVLVLVAIAAAGMVGFRTTRTKFSPPTEIKPGIAGTQTGAGVFLYAARTPSGVILFDTGLDPAAHGIDALLASLGSGRDQVQKIFLTHGHFDHLAGAAQFPGAARYLGEGDLGLAAGTASPDALMAKVLSLVMRLPPVAITNPLRGAATIPVAPGLAVRAIPVPGHTAGSYAFLYDGVLFPGDIMIYKQGRLEPTPAMFDAHPEENLASIRSLKTQLADEALQTICTAHGGCTPKGLGRNLLNDLVERIGAR
jgi:glyoxylase-like metal-dependent hydrolase (beta-lactamase superfamily II)